MEKAQVIENGNTCLGIEFGSTNIKAVLTGAENEVLASGSYRWASSFEHGYFTYSLEEVRHGLKAAYGELKQDVMTKYGVNLQTTGCIGISAMMHGYLAFNKDDNLLVPFRTWQNTTTSEAADRLSELFAFNIPERWSIAHLYQAILNEEEHIDRIAKITTLAGYVHYLLTGANVLGIGDASGMFPIDSEGLCYDRRMLGLFRETIKDRNLSWDIEEILPKILVAGEEAGHLTEAGAKLLDETGELAAGIVFCPPEGDAGTGMAATNSVKINTGNVSAGTSIFSMIVLDKPLADYYKEIDVVATPAGMPVAMVHCNNCTNDLNAWAGVFTDFLAAAGVDINDPGAVYRAIYEKAAEGDPDCGGTIVCNYIAGEPVTGRSKGCPFVIRDPEKDFKLSNLCRAFLYAAIVSLKSGMDVLKNEDIRIDRLVGHGGLFKNGDVASGFLASALKSQVCVMETAEVGGPYGMALLARYLISRDENETLEAFLEEKVFKDVSIRTSEPDEADAEGFDTYAKRFRELIDRL